MAELLCLEPVGGIAGDMFLALALDLGVPLPELTAALQGLGLPGWRLEVKRQARHEIEGTHLEVVLEGQPPAGHDHRAFADIRALLERSTLSAKVKETALQVFTRIAVAEAHVHGIAVDKVYFHEVGAVDSIVDVAGAAVALELLGWPEVLCRPPPLGSGITRSAHGTIPVPAPATMEILKDRAVRFEGVGELTTPTGAAIVAGLTSELPFPEMIVERVGYGVGTRDPVDRPNLLRGLLGRRSQAAAQLVVLEANLDDATPQILAYTVEAVLAAGALDAWISPLTMKKGRPGHLVGVLGEASRRETLTAILLRETTTLGVRSHAVERTALARRFLTVTTPYGPVPVKIGELDGKILSATPEYEDCARLARERGVPLKEVIAAASAAARTGHS